MVAVTARNAAASMGRVARRYQEVQRRTWCWSRPVSSLAAWKFSSTVQRLTFAMREGGYVAADQDSANDQTAESAIARYARAVTQPGGMNIDWPRVGAAGDVIVGLTAILGLRHRKWQ